jgi:hypothetical protein
LAAAMPIAETPGATTTRHDALRKVSLLRTAKVENGATAAEADSARRLGETLVDRNGRETRDFLHLERPLRSGRQGSCGSIESASPASTG